MKYRNDFEAPSLPDVPRDAHEHTPPDEYDLNFDGPIPSLRTNKVDLRPLIPLLYAATMVKGFASDPEIQLMLKLPVNDLGDALYWIERNMRRNSGYIPLAIFVSRAVFHTPPPDWSVLPQADPTATPGHEAFVYAGFSGYQGGSVGIMVFPFARGLGVASLVVALLMRWTMTIGEGGLGLRRLGWDTGTKNIRSQSLARKMGFKEEGVTRYCEALREGVRGDHVGREGDADWGKDTNDKWSASITCDDWEDGVRELVEEILRR